MSSETGTRSTIPGLTFIQHHAKNFLANVLKAGPVPQHIAFIMDGNRRFAKIHNQETREGHNAGFQSLSKLLELCYNTGIKTVSIYAFSIENFKRSQYEVDSLMEILKSRLIQVIERG